MFHEVRQTEFNALDSTLNIFPFQLLKVFPITYHFFYSVYVLFTLFPLHYLTINNAHIKIHSRPSLTYLTDRVIWAINQTAFGLNSREYKKKKSRTLPCIKIINNTPTFFVPSSEKNILNFSLFSLYLYYVLYEKRNPEPLGPAWVYCK